MRKIITLSMLVATMAMLFGQIATAQERGQQRNRGQRGEGQQDQQGRGQRGAGQQDQQGRGQRGPQGGQQRGGQGISMFALAAIESVQEELDLLDDQVKDIDDLQAKLRGDRGPQGRRGQEDNGDGDDLSEEEVQKQREERRAQATEQASSNEQKAVDGLKEILLDHQYDRLHEIYVQALGVSALQNEAIAKDLMITEKQKTEMQDATAKAREVAMEEFGKLRESGDRDAIQKRMTEIRGETESKVLKVLTAKQKSSFEKMKGKAFELPTEALRGQRGGGQRGGDQGGRGQRGGGQRGGDQRRGGGD